MQLPEKSVFLIDWLLCRKGLAQNKCMWHTIPFWTVLALHSIPEFLLLPTRKFTTTDAIHHQKIWLAHPLLWIGTGTCPHSLTAPKWLTSIFRIVAFPDSYFWIATDPRLHCKKKYQMDGYSEFGQNNWHSLRCLWGLILSNIRKYTFSICFFRVLFLLR